MRICVRTVSRNLHRSIWSFLFVDAEDVMEVNERLIQHVCKGSNRTGCTASAAKNDMAGCDGSFGSDKPDTRFGMELVDVSDVVKDCGFSVFTSALADGGSVRGINAKGQAEMPRKKIDALVNDAKGNGAKGLAYLALYCRMAAINPLSQNSGDRG